MKRKCLAVGIILLFVGTGVIQTTAQNIQKPSFPILKNNWLFIGSSGIPPVANFTIYNDSIVGVVGFDGSLSYDLDGIIISYEWDFGDGIFGTGMYVSHQYCGCGMYNVTLTVTDNDGLKGNLTKSVNVVLANIPPPETEIYGPVSGNVGTIYDYKFRAMFPEEITVFLFVDWGDGNDTGWIGPYSCYDFITLNHSWSRKGDYIIKAKVKDFCREGDWATFEIKMPYSYNVSFMRFLERLWEWFPHFLPLLKYLIQL